MLILIDPSKSAEDLRASGAKLGVEGALPLAVTCQQPARGCARLRVR